VTLARDFNPKVMRLAGFPRRSGVVSSQPAVRTRLRQGRRCLALPGPTGIPLRLHPITADTRPEQARDLTQDFFAYVLKLDLFAKADPAKGRFRAFLRTVCGRHLADQKDHEYALRRGGGRSVVSIDPHDADSDTRVNRPTN